MSPEDSLRLEALHRAVDASLAGDAPDEIVKRAEAFYEFLSGDSDDS